MYFKIKQDNYDILSLKTSPTNALFLTRDIDKFSPLHSTTSMSIGNDTEMHTQIQYLVSTLLSTET